MHHRTPRVELVVSRWLVSSSRTLVDARNRRSNEQLCGFSGNRSWHDDRFDTVQGNPNSRGNAGGRNLWRSTSEGEHELVDPGSTSGLGTLNA